MQEMLPSEEKRRVNCLIKLSVIFKRDFPDDIIEIMASALDDIKNEVIENEVTKIIKECRFWPSIAEIRERIIHRGYSESEGSPLKENKVITKNQDVSDEKITKFLHTADSYLDDNWESGRYIPDPEL